MARLQIGGLSAHCLVFCTFCVATCLGDVAGDSCKEQSRTPTDPFVLMQSRASRHQKRAMLASSKAGTCTWDPTRQGFNVTLYGHGECELRLCACLERRATSLVWDVAVRCGVPAHSVDMILTFRRRSVDEEARFGEGFVPDTENEVIFSSAIKTLIAKQPESNIVERIGFKLGTVEVPVEMLHASAVADPGQCDGDWLRSDGRVFARGIENSTLLLTAGSAVGSVEFRSFLPVGDVNLLTAKHQLVALVLKSMVEGFRIYRRANITHCDRGPKHITLGRAPSLDGALIAQIIDTDRVQQGFDVRMMAHWFGAMTYNVCRLDGKGTRMAFDGEGYDAWTSACFPWTLETNVKAAKWLENQLLEAERGADRDGMCRGMRELLSRVVKPAFQVAIGSASIDRVPGDWWAEELDKWADRFYPSNSDGLVDLDALFTELERKDRRDR